MGSVNRFRFLEMLFVGLLMFGIVANVNIVAGQQSQYNVFSDIPIDILLKDAKIAEEKARHELGRLYQKEAGLRHTLDKVTDKLNRITYQGDVDRYARETRPSEKRIKSLQNQLDNLLIKLKSAMEEAKNAGELVKKIADRRARETAKQITDKADDVTKKAANSATKKVAKDVAVRTATKAAEAALGAASEFAIATARQLDMAKKGKKIIDDKGRELTKRRLKARYPYLAENLIDELINRQIELENNDYPFPGCFDSVSIEGTAEVLRDAVGAVKDDLKNLYDLFAGSSTSSSRDSGDASTPFTTPKKIGGITRGSDPQSDDNGVSPVF